MEGQKSELLEWSVFNRSFEVSEMLRISQESVDHAFDSKQAKNVTVVRISDRNWYFTFEVDSPATNAPQVFTLETQRGDLRTWADPRNLVKYLNERYGVVIATLILKDFSNEQGNPNPE